MWYGLLSPLIAGLVYGAVRLYTQSTRAALLVHAAFGLFALVKLLTLMG
jgi:membrane protease YdiL (CAAX protease family)